MFTDFLSRFSRTISQLNHMPSSYMKPVCACVVTTTAKKKKRKKKKKKNTHTCNKVYSFRIMSVFNI